MTYVTRYSLVVEIIDVLLLLTYVHGVLSVKSIRKLGLEEKISDDEYNGMTTTDIRQIHKKIADDAQYHGLTKTLSIDKAIGKPITNIVSAVVNHKTHSYVDPIENSDEQIFHVLSENYVINKTEEKITDLSRDHVNATDIGQQTQYIDMLLKKTLTNWTRAEVVKYGSEALRLVCGSACYDSFYTDDDPFYNSGFSCLRCSCDNDCEYYGDCCYPKSTQLPRDSAFQCSKQIKHVRMPEPILTNKKCLDNFTDDNVRDLCDDSPNCHHFPVTTMDGVTYVNEQCAECNGVSKFLNWRRSTNWPISLSSYNMIYRHVQNVLQCRRNLYIKPPLNVAHQRTCDFHLATKDIINKCNVTKKWVEYDSALETNCLEHYVPFYSRGIGMVFQNVHCFLCNGFEVLDFSVETQSVKEITPSKLHGDTVLLKQQSDFFCNASWQLYNPYHNVCKEIQCPAEHLLIEGECQMKNISTVNFHFILWISYTDNLRENLKTHLMTLGINHYVVTLGVMLEQLYLHVFYETQLNNSADILTTIKSDWTFGTQVMLDDRLLSQKWIAIWNMMSDDVFLTCCEDGADGNKKLKNFVQLHELEICPHVIYDNEEFDMENRTLRLKETNLTFIEGEYSVKPNDKIHICVQALKNRFDSLASDDNFLRWESNTYVYHIYFSFGFTIVSLCCLIMTLITYCTFPVLRTLPAQNNMALIACLILAQTTMIGALYADKHRVICKIVGVLRHYWWLSAMFWMHICSFHMFSVFRSSNISVKSTNGQYKRLLLYFVYGNGMPLVIVSIVIIVSMTTSGTIGYGAVHCGLDCLVFIEVSFVLPVVIIILCNLTFLSLTIYSISKVSNIARTTGTERHHMIVYIKLSTLTGLFWIVEILSIYYLKDVLPFLSACLNYGQGIFLFLAYMANKRIVNLWLGLIGREWPVTSQMSSTKTKSTSV